MKVLVPIVALTRHNAGVKRRPAGTASSEEPWTRRLRERFARSRRVFLMSLVVACGIEVVVDWNSTLFEINVLRGRISERGISYVHILAGAADEAMQRRDTTLLAHLSEGLFADAQVSFVRFVDRNGTVLFEQLRPSYAAKFQRRRSQPFSQYYDKQLLRDVLGVMHDPERLRDRMANSRYRDFPQRWTDAINGLLAQFVAPPPVKSEGGQVMYQQAVRTAEHERDATVTWAFGTITGSVSELGAVLVAFDMDPTNDSILKKYLKGLGMVLFFVGLILFQNVSSRQDKLRLLDLERRYAEAKRAIRATLPGVVQAGDLSALGVLNQTQGMVDGQLFVLSAHVGSIDVLVLDPDGAGIEAATIALQVRREFLERRKNGPMTDLWSELGSLGEAGAHIPLSRPLGVMLVHIEARGAVSALSGPLGGLAVTGSTSSRLLQPMPEAAIPRGVVGPIQRFQAQLAPNETLVIGSAGIDNDIQSGHDFGLLIDFLVRAAPTDLVQQAVVDDAANWLRGRVPRLARTDLVVLTIACRPASSRSHEEPA